MASSKTIPLNPDHATDAIAKIKKPGERAFLLSVVEGLDAGKSVHLQGLDVPHLVGSSEACSLRLTDRAVSRRHFSVTITADSLRIDDLHSTNGTFVNGVRVFAAELTEEMVLRVGATTLRLAAAEQVPGASSRRSAFGRVLGCSPLMRRTYPTLQALCVLDTPALLEGEAGTGKELLAEVMHEQGNRADSPFFACDGGDVEIDLALFGSRTGAGLLTQATAGTVYISNVCDLPKPSQERLLTMLDGRSVERADRSTMTPTRVRLLVGSRRDVDREVQKGRFLEPLANAFARARVELPPLRVREGDIKLLAEHFWQQLEVGERRIDGLIMQRFERYAWPGNIPELQEAVARSSLTTGAVFDPTTQPLVSNDERIGEVAERLLATDLPLIQARTLLGDEFDRRYLRKVLAVHSGNVSRAAATSGIARRYLQTLKNKHGIGRG
jgi:two-component system, NtrC family, response regulator HydG